MSALGALVLAGLLPFAEGKPVFHPTAIPPYALENTVIRVRFDVARGVVYGQETATIRTRRSESSLPFDSLGIRYRAIRVDGKAAKYTINDPRQRLDVKLPRTARAGTRITVSFTYWAQPSRGVYFIRPDRAYPNVSPEIWTQGEATDNRRWFPTWDEPNAKTPSELIITVPRGWTAVANGTLKSHDVTGGNETWDWNSPHPKSTYLIAFAAGPFSRYHAALGTLTIDSYVPPQDAALNATCFRDTPRMIDYYQRVIGFAYPFAKYDQIAVERFTFGGMENASATILTDGALHPAEEDVEKNCDHLVSHELAQQWFGDDVTMADWSNEWINEGFATYFDELWSGQQGGTAAFEYARDQGEQLYFEEAQQYLRPIVDYRYNDPLDLFDVSGHERAAAVLHMLRYMVGDRRFFSALHAYLQQYQYKNASTDQFFASIDASLHEDLTWFKNEWFYRASYPHYYVGDSYDRAAKAVTLTVRQRNPDGKPFRMPVTIDVDVDGRIVSAQPLIASNRQTVRITGVNAPPQMILFDPNENLLRELTFPQPVSRLTFQLRNAPHVGDREWALAQLGALRATQAVSEAARTDPFFGIRADAVAVAARLGEGATVLAALRDRDTRVRIAAESAAAALTHPGPSVIAALTAMTRDRDPDVSNAALIALGTLHAPNAYALLRRSGSLEGLAALGDPRALPFILSKTAYGVPERERNTAVAAFAQLAKAVHRPQAALPTLLRLAERDPLISTRLAATAALGELGDAAAIPTLRRVETADTQEIVRITAWNAIMQIRPSSA
ncbi:MAG TPA: M1 family aminopeptidase [Candidatus Baltobacteraceae bacterium]|nr:M1 family aminopeptidase [Candidatus Baltobacteraceae bacterium]